MGSAQAEAVVSRVEVDDDQLNCPLCGEEFDVIFDDDSEEWMCDGAMKAQVMTLGAGVPTEKIVHVKCYTPGSVPVVSATSPRSFDSPDLRSLAPSQPPASAAIKHPLTGPADAEPPPKKLKLEAACEEVKPG